MVGISDHNYTKHKTEIGFEKYEGSLVGIVLPDIQKYELLCIVFILKSEELLHTVLSEQTAHLGSFSGSIQTSKKLYGRVFQGFGA